MNENESAFDRVMEISYKVGCASITAGDTILKELGFNHPDAAIKGLRAHIEMIRVIAESEEIWEAIGEEMRAAFTMARSQSSVMLAYLAGMNQIDANVERELGEDYGEEEGGGK